MVSRALSLVASGALLMWLIASVINAQSFSVKLFEPVKCRRQVLGQGRGWGGVAAVRCRVQDGFGGVYGGVNIGRGVVGQLGDVGSSGDKSSQECVFNDDAGVVGGVGGGWCAGLEANKCPGAAALVDEPGAGEFVGDRDRVDGFGPGEHVAAGGVDVAVCGPVEVRCRQHGDDFSGSVGGSQDGAEDGFFGVKVVGE